MKNVQKSNYLLTVIHLKILTVGLLCLQQYSLTKSKKNINGSNLGFVAPYPFQIKQIVFSKKTYRTPSKTKLFWENPQNEPELL